MPTDPSPPPPSQAQPPGPAQPPSQADSEIESLRERIRLIDLELIERAAERVELARRIGELKRAKHLPTVNYPHERIVIDRAKSAAARSGLRSEIAEELITTLIRASIIAQDEDSLRFTAAGTGRKAVIAGGAGRMGRWLTQFLSAQGFDVHLLDPALPEERNAAAKRELPGADLIVASTPPLVTAVLYGEWLKRPPSGLIVDIASIKTPLVEPVAALARAGGRVASIHPMFGPSTYLLRDADVVVCDTGDAAAAAEAEKLFASTTARIVHVPLADHDRIMADLLSLAHAAAIAFALALPEGGHPVRSTSFKALEKLAAAVVRESPDVYFEIQAMNPHSGESLSRLGDALDRIVEAVHRGDPAGFSALMADGRKRTEGTA